MELKAVSEKLALKMEEGNESSAKLVEAYNELAIQYQENEKLVAKLVIANSELAHQNQEKEARATELLAANKELAFQNQEKENRAAELYIANEELAIQNLKKEKTAGELISANKELAYQNTEKEKRAAELIIANQELAFQNLEKEKRSNELLHANKELETFAFISSHDLQEPLRKIQTFSSRILSDEAKNLSKKGFYYFERIQNSAHRMQSLINDLLVYSRSTEKEVNLEFLNLNEAINEVVNSFEEEFSTDKTSVSISVECDVTVIAFQFRQMLQNLLSNSIKFRKTDEQLQITISSKIATVEELEIRQIPASTAYSHIQVRDNGIGFDSEFKEFIFEIFRRIHDNSTFLGTGIGLTIVKKIVVNHNGYIFAEGELNSGATFDIYLPYLPNLEKANISENIK